MMTNERECEYGARVIRAGADHGSDPELARHIAGCPECTETARVGGFMQALARVPTLAKLPAPGFLLFRATLDEKRSAARRALMPIVWMKIAAVVAAVLGLIYLQVRSGLVPYRMIADTFGGFASIAPIAIIAIVGVAALCFAAARLMEHKDTGKSRVRSPGSFQLLG